MMKRAKGNNVDIALAVWEGKGNPLLCVHGIAANCRCWDTIACALAPNHPVFAMDLRGRGSSDKPPSGYSIMHHCGDIRSLLEDRGMERVVIMGHSLGALIGLAFAALYPDRVDRIILLDGGGKLTKKQTEKVFAGIEPTLDRLGKVFPSKRAYLDLMKANPLLQPWTPSLETFYSYELEVVEGGVQSRVNPEHIREERENLGSFDVEECYAKVECPAFILRATEGMSTPDSILLPEEALERMLRRIPDSRHMDIKGSNHYSIVLHPNEQRDRAIRSFIENEIPGHG